MNYFDYFDPGVIDVIKNKKQKHKQDFLIIQQNLQQAAMLAPALRDYRISVNLWQAEIPIEASFNPTDTYFVILRT